jgi:hypothetical protein
VTLTVRLLLAAALVPLSLVLSACDPSLPRPKSSSSASGAAGDFAPNATVPVVNDGRTGFDQQVKNAIADLQDFWRDNYPRISGGRPYPQLRGGI